MDEKKELDYKIELLELKLKLLEHRLSYNGVCGNCGHKFVDFCQHCSKQFRYCPFCKNPLHVSTEALAAASRYITEGGTGEGTVEN